MAPEQQEIALDPIAAIALVTSATATDVVLAHFDGYGGGSRAQPEPTPHDDDDATPTLQTVSSLPLPGFRGRPEPLTGGGSGGLVAGLSSPAFHTTLASPQKPQGRPRAAAAAQPRLATAVSCSATAAATAAFVLSLTRSCCDLPTTAGAVAGGCPPNSPTAAAVAVCSSSSSSSTAAAGGCSCHEQLLPPRASDHAAAAIEVHRGSPPPTPPADTMAGPWCFGSCTCCYNSAATSGCWFGPGGEGLLQAGMVAAVARAAAVVAAVQPQLPSMSMRRGLYEGTVRGGSVRNTWLYLSTTGHWAAG